MSISARVPIPVTHQELVDAAYDVLRGALKLHRDNVASHIADQPNSDATVDVILGMRGYTCSQWHHEDNPSGIKQSVIGDMQNRLNESDLNWDDVTFKAELGEMHDVNAMTGAELLDELEAPSETPIIEDSASTDKTEDSGLLKCPDCGEERFSIILNEVYFGHIQPGGDEVTPYFESQKRGDHVETAPTCRDNNGNDIVFCVGCEHEYAITEDGLKHVTEASQTVVPKDALDTVLEFVRSDPALDTAPKKSDVPDAITRLNNALHNE